MASYATDKIHDAIRRLATNTYTMGEDRLRDLAYVAVCAEYGDEYEDGLLEGKTPQELLSEARRVSLAWEEQPEQSYDPDSPSAD